jgi:hypothetical protein
MVTDQIPGVPEEVTPEKESGSKAPLNDLFNTTFPAASFTSI